MKVLYLIILLLPAIGAFVLIPKKLRDKISSWAKDRSFRGLPYSIILMRIVLVYLLIFHFLTQALKGETLTLIPSTIVCILMYNVSVTNSFFHFIKVRRNLWAFMIFSLGCLVTKEFFALGFTLSTLLITSIYYNLFYKEWTRHKNHSKRMIEKVESNLYRVMTKDINQGSQQGLKPQTPFVKIDGHKRRTHKKGTKVVLPNRI